MADISAQFIRGWEAGGGLVERAKQLRLQEKEQQSRQALIALQTRKFELDSELTGLKAYQELQELRLKVRQERGITQIAELMSTMDPSDPATDKAVWAAVKDNPSVPFHDKFQGILTYLNSAKAAKRMEETAAATAITRTKQAEAAETRAEAATKNADLREREINFKLKELGGRLPPVKKAELDAALRAIVNTDDIFMDVDEKQAKIAEVISRFQTTPEIGGTNAPVRTYVPGQGWKR